MPEDAKVHVGNLSFDAKEEDLTFEFKRYGRVEQGECLSILVVFMYYTIAQRIDSVLFFKIQFKSLKTVNQDDQKDMVL